MPAHFFTRKMVREGQKNFSEKLNGCFEKNFATQRRQNGQKLT